MPKEYVEEILNNYADVIRTGSLTVNGATVSWVTEDCTSRQQLENFCDVLLMKLRSLPELARLNEEEMCQAVFLYCKSVSLNYVVMDVLLMLQQEFGELCTIETYSRGACLLSYGLLVREGPRGPVLLPRLKWTKPNNVVGEPAHEENHVSRCVKGTLSSIYTEFPLALEPGHVPDYSIRLQASPCVAWWPALVRARRNATRLLVPSAGALQP